MYRDFRDRIDLPCEKNKFDSGGSFAIDFIVPVAGTRCPAGPDRVHCLPAGYAWPAASPVLLVKADWFAASQARLDDRGAG